MKNTLRILVIILFSVILFQNCQKSDFVVVTGILRDSVTNLPLEGIQIEVDGKQLYSAEDGSFTLDGAKPGKHNVYIYDRSRQYYSKQSNILVSEGRVNKADFRLHPIPQPQVVSGSVSKITGAKASAKGSIKFKVGTYNQYGHVWSSTSIFPSLTENTGYTNFGQGSGTINFESEITSLEPNLVYYIRAYVVTSAGQAIYGDVLAFRTSELDLDAGLIFNFPFDNNNLDHSGNGFNLSAESGFWPYSSPTYTTDRFGTPQKACRFVNSKWYGGGHHAVNDFTVSLWFRKNNLWEPNQEHLIQIGDRYSGRTQERIIITQEPAPASLSVAFYVNGSLGTKYKISLNRYPALDTWHHVVARREGTTFSMYLNGILISSISCPSDVLPTSSYFNIGGAWLPAYQQFHGDLDEVRFYNRALSDNEIQYLSKN